MQTIVFETEERQGVIKLPHEYDDFSAKHIKVKIELD